ncbi:thioesterase II family protein [Streptomyces sp. HB132]|uniref:thioesterase II family protein n=1 Tax=Streptomyces sp. HB132 TaxID=767388 RepID=UPI00195FF1A1|nr:alpha/beta fold hydrolase [Streptomyces sp. HB132]MBM7442873.1 surfactin synthase thioesterase subunit/aryl carrier-like protein [Streptomyces sp. HB132]
MNSETEMIRAAVLQAWRDTLEAEPASDDENFFEAGGNSILAVALQRRLVKALGRAVPLRQIHEHPTVAGLLGISTAGLPSGRERTAGGSPALTLYCLPYAGASARMYADWDSRMPSSVTVKPLELPGRGARWSEPALTGMAALLEDLAGAMDEARHTPYALFGHSFGGVLAFELTRHLTDRGFPASRRLLVSACPAPHEATPVETNHDLSDEEFTERLRKLRGTPEELLENEELMELYLPTIRADYTILDHYRAPRITPLNCPVSVFHGADDQDVPEASVGEWAQYSNGSFAAEEITGDHFFLRDSEDELLAKLALHLGGEPAGDE